MERVRIMLLLNNLLTILTHTPLYPHWLEFRNRRRGENELYLSITGNVLETGAGNTHLKQLLLKLYPKKITSYLATDYSSWDDIFEQFSNQSRRFGKITQILYDQPQTKAPIDQVVDALHLPFANETFNTYCSFETLEHIHDPEKFFSEAVRVLQPGGKVVISVPFLYREHSGGSGFDYFRYTKSELTLLAEKHDLTVKKIFTYSFFGTSMAALINQYIIRKFIEGNILMRLLLLFYKVLAHQLLHSGLHNHQADQWPRKIQADH